MAQDLSNNPLGPESVDALYEALQYNPQISYLNLSGTYHTCFNYFLIMSFKFQNSEVQYSQLANAGTSLDDRAAAPLANILLVCELEPLSTI